jgi:hypothetical protein
MGENRTSLAKLARIKGLFSGTFREWNGRNVAALRALEPRLTERARLTFDLFAIGRESPLVLRLNSFHSSGIYRQTLLGNLGLTVAAFINRI